MATGTSHVQLDLSAAQSNAGASFFEGAHGFSIENQINHQNNITIINHPQKSALDTLCEKLNPLIPDATHLRDLKKYPPDSQCLPGTRRKIIQQIKAWADSGILLKGVPSHVLWLYGYVGCGKSAIAQTVAEKFAQKDRLAASFFFFRGMGDRSRSARFATTIASQLARKIPATIPLIDVARIACGNELSSASVATQFEHLFLRPLHAALRSPGRMAQSLFSGPYLTVIDGFDECEDQEDISGVIEKITGFFKDKPRSPLRFFISSRVRDNISGRLRGQGPQIEEMDLAAETSEEEIKFVVDETFRIAAKHNRVIQAYGGWPSEEDKARLVKNADKSYIIISTLLKFILESPKADDRTPLDRLPLALDFKNGLDGLYAEILSRSQGKAHFYNVISTIALTKEPLSSEDIGKILHISNWEVVDVLNALCAIFHLPGNEKEPITLFHSSLREYLCTESRSAPHFFVSPSHHKFLALRLFEHVLVPGVERLPTCAKRYFDHHWESNVALHNEDASRLRMELRESVAYFQGEFNPFPPDVVHHSIVGFALLDLYWLTTVSLRQRKNTIEDLAVRFVGRTRKHPEIAALANLLHALGHLLSALEKREATDSQEELQAALQDLETSPESPEDATITIPPPLILSQHTLLVESCLSHLFTFEKASQMPIVFVPDRDKPAFSRVKQSLKQPGVLDVSDYSFWSLSFHLAEAIQHDPGLTHAILTCQRGYSRSTGLKEPMPPFEYLVTQHRYFTTEQSEAYLQALKSRFEVATFAVEGVMQADGSRTTAAAASRNWGFTKITGNSNYWAYGCFDNDLSILNLWTGYTKVIQCFLEFKQGTHSNDTCSLHKLYDTARGEDKAA